MMKNKFVNIKNLLEEIEISIYVSNNVNLNNLNFKFKLRKNADLLFEHIGDKQHSILL